MADFVLQLHEDEMGVGYFQQDGSLAEIQTADFFVALFKEHYLSKTCQQFGGIKVEKNRWN